MDIKRYFGVARGQRKELRHKQTGHISTLALLRSIEKKLARNSDYVSEESPLLSEILSGVININRGPRSPEGRRVSTTLNHKVGFAARVVAVVVGVPFTLFAHPHVLRRHEPP